MLEDLHEGFGSILLSSSLDILGQASHRGVTVVKGLELNNLVRVAPFLNLENLGLVFILKELATLFFRADVHNEQADDI